jgi:hypothetical protein
MMNAKGQESESPVFDARERKYTDGHSGMH